RPLPRGSASHDRPCDSALLVGLPRDRRARLWRGRAGRASPDRVSPLARRTPARAGPRPLARSILLPARVRADTEPGLVALRAAVLAPLARPRRGARLERLRVAHVCRGRPARLRLAARARPRPGRGACRRTCLRDRTLPRGPDDRSPARADLAALTTLAVGV